MLGCFQLRLGLQRLAVENFVPYCSNYKKSRDLSDRDLGILKREGKTRDVKWALIQVADRCKLQALLSPWYFWVIPFLSGRNCVQM